MNTTSEVKKESSEPSSKIPSLKESSFRLQFEDRTFALSENEKLMKVNSIEEIAILLKSEDDEYRYEYHLFEKRVPKNSETRESPTQNASSDTLENLGEALKSAKAVTPPPFSKPIVKQEVKVDPMSAEVSKQELTGKNQKNINNSGYDQPAKVEVEDVAELIQNADVLLSAGETELARNIYRAVLKTTEQSEAAYAGLARCADQEGMIEQAIQFAWDSVAFKPNRPGYELLSQLLMQQGRDGEAIQVLGRAMRSLDLSVLERAEYHKTLGNAHSRLNQTSEAEQHFLKALALSPQSDEVQSNLGSLYLEQSKIPQAKRCYQDAIGSNPANDKAWVGLGLCLISEGDKESAHEAFSRALDRNLRNSTAIFHLVKCAYEIKKYPTAEKMLSQYVEVAPVSPSLLYSLAGLQFHVGKTKEAQFTAKRVLGMKPDHQGAKDLIQRIEGN